jgi:spore coat protein U-like protein
MRKYILPIVAVAAMAPANSAFAAQASSSFDATVTIAAPIVVAPSCTVSATAMDFGTINASATTGTETATSDVTVNCSVGAQWKLSLVSSGTSPTPVLSYSNNLKKAGSTAFIPVTFEIDSVDATGTGDATDQSSLITGTLGAKSNLPDGTYTRTQSIFVQY